MKFGAKVAQGRCKSINDLADDWSREGLYDYLRTLGLFHGVALNDLLSIREDILIAIKGTNKCITKKAGILDDVSKLTPLDIAVLRSVVLLTHLTKIDGDKVFSLISAYLFDSDFVSTIDLDILKSENNLFGRLRTGKVDIKLLASMFEDFDYIAFGKDILNQRVYTEHDAIELLGYEDSWYLNFKVNKLNSWFSDSNFFNVSAYSKVCYFTWCDLVRFSLIDLVMGLGYGIGSLKLMCNDKYDVLNRKALEAYGEIYTLRCNEVFMNVSKDSLKGRIPVRDKDSSISKPNKEDVKASVKVADCDQDQEGVKEDMDGKVVKDKLVNAGKLDSENGGEAEDVDVAYQKEVAKLELDCTDLLYDCLKNGHSKAYYRDELYKLLGGLTFEDGLAISKRFKDYEDLWDKK